MAITLSLGFLILRVVAGLTIAVHGAQELAGWFGGGGFSQMIKTQEQMGFKPAIVWAILAALGDLGGLSLALGLLTPLGAAGIVGMMFMAIAKVHWKNGFFNSKDGIEFPLLLLTSALVVGIVGPGSYSLDSLLGIALPNVLLFGILAVISLLVDITGLITSNRAAIEQTETQLGPP